MSEDEGGSGLKASRKECYRARDEYFRCADEHQNDEKKCRVFLKEFKEKCPASWVPHFIRKHDFAKYKAELVQKGVLKADEEYQKGAKSD